MAALVLAGLGVGVAAAFGAFEDRYDFERESTALLESLSRGEAAAVYEGAAYQFRETHLLDSFVDLVDRMDKTFGAFRGITSVEDNQRHRSLAGRTAMVTYLVRYDEATTEVSISYLENEAGDWQLLGLDLAIPPALADKAARLEAQYDRITAPDDVTQKVGAMLVELGKGELDAVLAEASPPFRESVTAESFAVTLSTLEKELGDFVRVLAVLSSAQNDARDRAHVDALLEYQRGRTTGSFEFLKVDGVWKLLNFKVVVPEPLLPAR